MERISRQELEKNFKHSYQKAVESHPHKFFYILSDTKLDLGLCSEIRSLSEVVHPLSDCAFICYNESDEDLTDNLKVIKDAGSLFFNLLISHPPAKYVHKNKRAKLALTKTYDDIVAFSLSHCEYADFQNIMQAIELTKGLTGDYVEIGVYKGTSSNAAMHYLAESGIIIFPAQEVRVTLRAERYKGATVIAELIETRIKEVINKTLPSGGAIPDVASYIETDNFGEVIEKLVILHIRQWMIEDAIGVAKTDTEVADLKRKIDICFKVKRPKYIQAINLMVDAAIKHGKSLVEDSVKVYRGVDRD